LIADNAIVKSLLATFVDRNWSLTVTKFVYSQN